MKATVWPGRLNGEIRAIPSKSHAHRLLILSSLCETATRIICRSASDDILATAQSLSALGAGVLRDECGFTVTPGKTVANAALDCGESASTYRFLLPLAACLGTGARFVLGEGLKKRPVRPFIDQLTAHGALISGNTLVSGKLSPGEYRLAGDISSQFVSGLCMALPLLESDSEIIIDGELQSRGYVDMTLNALKRFGVYELFAGNRIRIPGGGRYISPGAVRTSGDWSSSAMFLCGAAAGGDVRVSGLDASSAQPDGAIIGILKSMGADVNWDGSRARVKAERLSGRVVDVSGTPDLAPALALAAVAAEGETVITGAKRLRYKESDRVESIVSRLARIGANAFSRGDDIVIRGTGRVRGGSADAAGDHRIAMMLACAAVISQGPIEISGAQAVRKSYPSFFSDLRSLGLDVLEEEK